MNYKIVLTLEFDKWLKKLDGKTTNRILSRLYRVAKGNFGDTKQIVDNIHELRFFFGAGYRIYYNIKDNEIILLLCGGDKSSQARDIEKAKKILKREMT